jgi:hypothetical protein
MDESNALQEGDRSIGFYVNSASDLEFCYFERRIVVLSNHAIGLDPTYFVLYIMNLHYLYQQPT